MELPVAGPFDHAVQEEDLTLPFAHFQPGIGSPREGVNYFSQFMKVRGEERARSDFTIMEVLGDRPREGQTVPRRSSAADLVKNQEAALGHPAENLRCFR